MILNRDRQPLHFRVKRGPLRHRPRLKHPVKLQAKVIVKTPSGVFLNHENERPLPGFLLGRWLRSPLKIPFLFILFKHWFHYSASVKLIEAGAQFPRVIPSLCSGQRLTPPWRGEESHNGDPSSLKLLLSQGEGLIRMTVDLCPTVN